MDEDGIKTSRTMDTGFSNIEGTSKKGKVKEHSLPALLIYRSSVYCKPIGNIEMINRWYFNNYKQNKVNGLLGRAWNKHEQSFIASEPGRFSAYDFV